MRILDLVLQTALTGVVDRKLCTGTTFTNICSRQGERLGSEEPQPSKTTPSASYLRTTKTQKKGENKEIPSFLTYIKSLLGDDKSGKLESSQDEVETF